MPELPEVETTKRGIGEHITGLEIADVSVHNPALRWPVPADKLKKKLPGLLVRNVKRRAKYLLLGCGSGTLVIHLGMSGSLRVLDEAVSLDPHEHVVIHFSNGKTLRLRDPRRFGAVLWTELPVTEHRLLINLGPEPLDEEFDAAYLYKQTRKRKCNIKSLVMNAHIVVGVGNIYATEALFHAGIRPGRQAGRLSRNNCTRLVAEIKQVLTRAIEVGGTTLRDFTDSNGRSGYFSLSLAAYGRDGQACLNCGSIIKKQVLAQRSSFYCPNCQK
jgi:formamidopyrimidine-DNA glycosylase